MKVVSHEEAYAPYEGTEWGTEHEIIEYPEGFRERLQGKSIEEQTKLFAILENTTFSRSSYGEVDSERAYRYARRLESVSEFRGVIVRDGLIEGILVKTPWSVSAMGPYDTLTTYYADDNDGAGSSCREDTVTLVCLPPDREWD